VYLSKCRQDLDERNRTIDNQAKALERLRPIVERFEREIEQRDSRATSVQESQVSAKFKHTVTKTEDSYESVEIDEIVKENEKLTKELQKANDEITRLRNNVCDISDIVDKNDLSKMDGLGKTFDYGINQYPTGDAEDHCLNNSLSKTFDMGVKPIVIPVLDFNKLKQVKAYKDWYGYSQKLEKSIRILRIRIKCLEDEQIEMNGKYNKVLVQNRNLYALNEKLNNTIKKLNEKLKKAINWKNQFEMTMPNMGPNYVSFTMMDMHKTINNSKNEMIAMHNKYNGLDHSFNDSDHDEAANFAQEIHQFSQNSTSKEKDSSDRPHHKKSQSISIDKMIKPRKKGLESANNSSFSGSKYDSKISEDIKIAKVQIKNPKDIGKYVQRNKKRGHNRKRTQFVTSSKDDLTKTFDVTQAKAKKLDKKMTIKEMIRDSSNPREETDKKFSASFAQIQK
jgi:hypothetical protein